MLKKLKLLKKISYKGFSNSFMNPTNMLYLEQKYAEWMNNPQSVPVSYQVYFENIDSPEPFPNPFDLPPVSIQ